MYIKQTSLRYLFWRAELASPRARLMKIMIIIIIMIIMIIAYAIL